jgi:hypothetical protein
MIFNLVPISPGISTLVCDTPQDASALHTLLFATYWRPVPVPSLVITKSNAYSVTLVDNSKKLKG